MESTLYEQLGGEHKLRAIIDHFVARMLADGFIGFFFARVPPGRLARLEFEHAAVALGAPLRYSGRPLQRAHARHRIAAGHFGRRRTLLAESLAHFAVPAPVVQAWLAHQDALRPQIVGTGTGCG